MLVSCRLFMSCICARLLSFDYWSTLETMQTTQILVYDFVVCNQALSIMTGVIDLWQLRHNNICKVLQKQVEPGISQHHVIGHFTSCDALHMQYTRSLHIATLISPDSPHYLRTISQIKRQIGSAPISSFLCEWLLRDVGCVIRLHRQLELSIYRWFDGFDTL